MVRLAVVNAYAGLSSYLDTLCDGARVLVAGSRVVALAETLIERGARAVHVYDADPDARSNVKGVSLHTLTDDEFDARPHAFDLVVAPEITLGFERLLSRLRRMTAESGALFVGTSARPNTPTYEEVFELAAVHFTNVRAIGESPFVGVAWTEFTDDGEASEVTVDTDGAREAQRPNSYWIVASEASISLPQYHIVQLDAPAAPRDENAELELAELRVRVEALRTQLEEQRERPQYAAKDSEDWQRLMDERDARIASLDVRARKEGAKAQSLAIEAESLRTQLSEKERELSELHARLDRNPIISVIPDDADEIKKRDLELLNLTEKVAEQISISSREALLHAEEERALSEELAARAARAEEAETRLRVVENELAKERRERTEECEAFEAAMKERASAFKVLEEELRLQKKSVEELIVAMANRPSTSTLHADELAQNLAREQEEVGRLRSELRVRFATGN